MARYLKLFTSLKLSTSRIQWAAILFLTLAEISADEPCEKFESAIVSGIRYQGLLHTRPAVVDREMRHREGSHFNCLEWEQEKKRLQGLDIFADIALYFQDNDGAVDLEYRFKEVPAYIPFVTVKKTDQDGFSAGPALASLNFLGQAIRLQGSARFGGTNEILLLVSSRWLHTLPIKYDLAYIRVDSDNAFDDYRETSNRGVLEMNYRIKPWFEPVLAAELWHLKEDRARPELLLSGGAADWVPRLGAGFVVDTRDVLFNPSRGIYHEMRWTQSGGPLGGPSDFQEWLSDTRAFFPLARRDIVHVSLLYRYRTGELGETIGIYDDFHLGGGNSLRGFAPNTTSGKSEVLLTLENRLDLLGRRTFSWWKINLHYGLQLVAGMDWAANWNHDVLLGGELFQSAFGGVHVLLPGVDRIRLELGSGTAKFDMVFTVAMFEKSFFQRFRDR